MILKDIWEEVAGSAALAGLAYGAALSSNPVGAIILSAGALSALAYAGLKVAKSKNDMRPS